MHVPMTLAWYGTGSLHGPQGSGIDSPSVAGKRACKTPSGRVALTTSVISIHRVIIHSRAEEAHQRACDRGLIFASGLPANATSWVHRTKVMDQAG